MKENSEFKPVKLCLKIDVVSYPARAEGSVNRIILGIIIIGHIRMYVPVCKLFSLNWNTGLIHSLM